MMLPLRTHSARLMSTMLVSWTLVASALADPGPKIGERLERRGDEIVACGQLFHTTTKVVPWTDPGGYDAYRVELRFAPWEMSSWPFGIETEFKRPARLGVRKAGLSADLIDKVRGGGWDLPSLQKVVDQFVIHYDARGTSQRCYQVLHDKRGLSVHFMLDLDGTIYQTLDIKERAFHATISNDRSIGIEIANLGAYPPDRLETLKKWYQPDSAGKVRITFPTPADQASIRSGKIELRPSRNELVPGTVQGQSLMMYDLTPQQYEALIRLTATLCTIFPKIQCDYPRDASGALISHKLPDADWAKYQGILGHFHVQKNKTDPGPAFQWDKVIHGARELMAK